MTAAPVHGERSSSRDHQVVRQHAGAGRYRTRHRRRRIHHAGRRLRLWQVHADPDHRRPRAADLRQHGDRRAPDRPPAPARAARGDGVSELRAVPAHERRRQHRAAAHHAAAVAVGAVAARQAAVASPSADHGRHHARSGRHREPAADRVAARAPPCPAVGWPAAARGARTRDGAPPRRVPHGRAAVQSRREAARPHAQRAGRAARSPAVDLHLRDARPGRGDDDVRSGGDDGRRAHPPARHAHRALHASGEPQGRAVHRQPGDQRAPRRRRQRRPGERRRRDAAAHR